MLGKINRFFTDLSSHLSLLAMLGAGAVLTGAFATTAKLTAPFAAYAPFSWVAAAALGILMSLCLVLVGSTIRNSILRGNVERISKTKSDNINPLDRQFTNRRIYIQDLVPLFSSVVEGKIFDGCEIIGPANIFMAGHVSIGEDCKWLMSDFIIVKPGCHALNVIALKHCTFRNCTLAKLSLMIPPDGFFEHGNIASANWITPTPETP